MCRLQIINKGLEFELPGETTEIHLELKPDFTVEVLATEEGAHTGEVGSWSPVYDQSLVVTLPERNSKLTANWRYHLKDVVKPQHYDQLKTGTYEAFDSICSETMVGVKLVHGEGIECWVGKQTSPATTKVAYEEHDFSALILAQTSATVETETAGLIDLMNENQGFTKRLGSFSDIPESTRKILAQTINESNLTWKADPYIQDDTSFTFAQIEADIEAEAEKGQKIFG